MNELKEIYQALVAGQLSKEDAFAKIKAAKLKGANIKDNGSLAADSAHSLLIGSEKWVKSPLSTDKQVESSKIGNAPPFKEQFIILAGFEQIDISPHKRKFSRSTVIDQIDVDRHLSAASQFSAFILACFEKVKTIIESKPKEKVCVCLVLPNELHTLLAATALLKTAQLENPMIVGKTLIFDEYLAADAMMNLIQDELLHSLDSVVKYSDHNRYRKQWQDKLIPQGIQQLPLKDHGGVYLITGGLGGLGCVFAQEISRRVPYAYIVLTGRRPLSGDREGAFDRLKSSIKRLEYHVLDVESRADVVKLMQAISKSHGTIDGILHCAGGIKDNFILNKNSTEFSSVLGPKVKGLENIDKATIDIKLDFILLFSSFAARFGNVGQADYAAANAFMDHYAAHRNALAVKGKRFGYMVSINWPLWKDGGMEIDESLYATLRAETGIQPLSLKNGFDAFCFCVMNGYTSGLTVEGNAEELRQKIFSKIRIESPIVNKKEQKGNISSADLKDRTNELLIQRFANALKISADRIEPGAPLELYGIDSILAINLVNQLEESFGPLSKTLFFEYQNIEELTEYFIKSHSETLYSLLNIGSEDSRYVAPVFTGKELKGFIQPSKKLSSRRRFKQRLVHSDGEPATVSGHQAEPQKIDKKIAIVGISGRYPESYDINGYWENLQSGKDCITEVPESRWRWQEFYTTDRTEKNKHYSKWGGFIEGVDEFDPLFFNISPLEAESIDPQERLFLQHAWMAVEDAGYSKSSLQAFHIHDLPGQVGVYAGVMYGEYKLSGSLASIANRVSYVMNLHGPSMTLDTMCSSSLTAMHLACQDLILGRTHMGIAGGVNVSIHPNKYSMLSAGQFISSDGHCQSFGEGGDGYIPGEGVGVVILKRLSDAEQQGDHIYGVIRSSVLNHGGKTNGYSVPNPKAQANAIRQALDAAEVNARHVSYIEAHGTGTKLGDPLEIAALTQAFQADTDETAFCLLGSAKSNIGHCESAAGIAGVTKILLQMRHGKIVPSLHSKRLNPHIDFSKTPFIVNQTLKDWPVFKDGEKDIPRIAGISSFGAGGSNAHLIIEEYAQRSDLESNLPIALKVQAQELIIPFSARTEAQLRQKAEAMVEFLQQILKESQAQNQELSAGHLNSSFAEIAYTLQVGRDAMDERLGIIANNESALLQALQAFLAGEEGDGIYRGKVKNNRETLSLFNHDADLKEAVTKWTAQRKYRKLADMWVKGLSLDWHALYGDTQPRRVSLPTYPFARDRYWLTPIGINNNRSGVHRLHPLVHRNSSTLECIQFSSCFSAGDALLKNGALIAPVYFEMALEAAKQATSAPASQVAVLSQIRWGQGFFPLDSNKDNQEKESRKNENYEKDIHIALFEGASSSLEFEIYSEDESQNEELIHCQGKIAVDHDYQQSIIDIAQVKGHCQLTTEDRLEGLDLEAMGVVSRYEGQGQGLIELINLSHAEGKNTQEGLAQLSPVIAQVFNVLEQFPPGENTLVTSLDELQVRHPPGERLFLWLRDNGGKHDVDVCDRDGRLCLRLHGVGVKNVTGFADAPFVPKLGGVKSAVRELKVTRSPVTTSPAVKQASQDSILKATRIELLIPRSRDQANTLAENALTSVIDSNVIAKPNNVQLPVLQKSAIDTRLLTKPKQVRLSSLSEIGTDGTNAALISLWGYEDGVYVLEIHTGDKVEDALSFAAQMEDAFKALDNYDVKVLLLQGNTSPVLGEGRAVYQASQSLLGVVNKAPYPVIAALPGSALDAGFMLAALCDVMFLAEEGEYGFQLLNELGPDYDEYQFFQTRFGEPGSQYLNFGAGRMSGNDVRQLGWGCQIAPSDDVVARAMALARRMAQMPLKSLHLLKAHLARHVYRVANALENTSIENIAPEKATPEKTALKAVEPQRIIPECVNKILKVSEKESTLLLEISATEFSTADAQSLVSELLAVLSLLKSDVSYHALVLASELNNFLPEDIQSEQTHALAQALNEVSIPTIAALSQNAQGQAWNVALLCDDLVYASQGHYSANTRAEKNGPLYPTAFAHRLGPVFASEVLFGGKIYTGKQLAKRVGVLQVEVPVNVVSSALARAKRWGNATKENVSAWKDAQNLALRHFLTPLNITADPAVDADLSRPLSPQDFGVVSVETIADSVALVRMADRDARNMFSDALIEGMQSAFAFIAQTPKFKVVILTGVDHYFASGGTKANLLSIQDGSAKFTDVKIFQLALDCEVPVIAAMQGHGIGAGWSMGMFADITIFSEESQYVSPYMRYGFTPGAGASLVIPAKMGQDFARESLLSAHNYRGSELAERGLGLSVYPRASIMDAALALAKDIAACPRARLRAIKSQLSEGLRLQVEDTYARELAMHEDTFVGDAETLATIEQQFAHGSEVASNGQKPQATSDNIMPAEKVSVSASVSATETSIGSPYSLADILEAIKEMLAEELHLPESEIDDNTEFVDLGLDSITGVTWIRKINECYGTDIEATKVYQYPTLKALAEFVKSLIEPRENEHSVLSQNALLPSAINRKRVETQTANIPHGADPAKATQSPKTTQAKLLDELRSLLASELRMDEDDIDKDAKFIDLGVDSIIGVSWVNKINQAYGTSIETTKVYSSPTLEAFTEFVFAEVGLSEGINANPEDTSDIAAQTTFTIGPGSLRASAGTQKIFDHPNLEKLVSIRKKHSVAALGKAMSSRQPVAVIGMAGQFAMANNVEQFWENIAQGKDCISEIRDERWRLSEFFQEGGIQKGKTYSKWLGALDEYDCFDPQFFNISPTEAEHIDPQQRLFLQNCWNAIENAGYDPQVFSGSKCGVFVGCAGGDYHLQSRESQLSAQGFTGEATSILAARIAYFLNLQGPCLSIDTACSSSLVALASACDSLNIGNSDTALVGGVYVMSGPDMHIKTAQSAMLSPNGRCFTFDQRADGFVPGEGAGVVLLKTLSRALEDKDAIVGVIEGWGVNQDGKSNGITAPNPDSQTRLEQEVYDTFAINPDEIQLIEAHGTGTKLGDPIEIEGLKNAFGKYTERKSYCAIGSVKSNIGHCLTAAGVSALIKTLMAIQYQQIPPTIHYQKANEHLTIENSPFYISESLRPWQIGAGEKRRAAVSSFGFSGTNAHVVVSEFSQRLQAESPLVKIGGQFLFPFSAKNPERLKERLSSCLSFFKNNETVDRLLRTDNTGQFGFSSEENLLSAVAFTLQVGRSQMEYRLGVVADSLTQLCERLENYLSGQEKIGGIFHGSIYDNKEKLSLLAQDEDMRETMIARWINNGQGAKLLDLWAQGLDLKWHGLYQGETPVRVSLPVYPFAKERYWLEHHGTNKESTSSAQAILHPLIHENVSILSGVRFRSRFSANDERICLDQDTLQVSALIAMVKVALDQALDDVRPVAYGFKNMLWSTLETTKNEPLMQTSIAALSDSELIIEISEMSQGQVHLQGDVSLIGDSSCVSTLPRTISVQKALRSKGMNISGTAFYDELAGFGRTTSDEYRQVNTVSWKDNLLVADIGLFNESAHCDLITLALTQITQVSQFFVCHHSSLRYVPDLISAQAITLKSLKEGHYSLIVSDVGHMKADNITIDACLVDEDGNLCITIDSLSLKKCAVARTVHKSGHTDGRSSIEHEALSSLRVVPGWRPLAGDYLNTLPAIAADRSRHCLVWGMKDKTFKSLQNSSSNVTCVSVGQGLPNGNDRDKEEQYRANTLADEYKNTALDIFIQIKNVIEKEKGRKIDLNILIALNDADDFNSRQIFLGLGAILKTAKLESPNISGGVTFIDRKVATEKIIDILMVRHAIPAPIIRLRVDALEVFYWREHQVSNGAAAANIVFKEHGTYLITGGLGAIGQLMTREILTQTSQSTIILTGRSDISQENARALAVLSENGATVAYEKVDLLDIRSLESLVQKISEEHQGLNGVIHCAGISQDNFIIKKSVDEFAQTLDPKVLATTHLDIASKSMDLDFMVYFSSVASAFGNVGQADYAVANAYMDHYAHYRNHLVDEGKRKGRTLSFNWPLWNEGGMEINEENRQILRARYGVVPMPTPMAMKNFYEAFSFNSSQALVLYGDTGTIKNTLLHEGEKTQETSLASTSTGDIDEMQLLKESKQFLREQFSEVLKLPIDKMFANEPLEVYGIDSIMAMDITRKLEKTFGQLPKTLFYEHQSIEEMAPYFVNAHSEVLLARSETKHTQPEQVIAEVQHGDTNADCSVLTSRFDASKKIDFSSRQVANSALQKVAVIGLSGRYSQSQDIKEYWRNLKEGRDCIVEVPADRWDWQAFYSEDKTLDGAHFSKWGGFIQGAKEFDPIFFNISPFEAEQMDPQERILLQHAWMAIEDAGYTRETLQIEHEGDQSAQVGVYVGVTYGEYNPSGSLASIANRVSYLFNLHGPSMAIDTMCSSSLMAIHLACQDLKCGRTDMALAGGVNLSIDPGKYSMLSAGHFISNDGHCQSFGEGGDGYIPGEGVGVAVLKLLNAALKDGDHIYGVIRGSAVNHGGKTNGYSVPNPVAQANTISRALRETHTDARHISYIEAHGTGTKLGDPIEIAALNQAFEKYTQDKQFCLVGSAKSNVGHCESAAGISGVTKVLLQLKHKMIVPSLHSQTLNPHIDFETSPFIVNQRLIDWTRPNIDGREIPRIAGISSFGAGGANVHLIVEEAVENLDGMEAIDVSTPAKSLILLSAKTAEQLQQRASDLLDYVLSEEDNASLTRIAYTLQVGREAMSERLALVVNSVEQLAKMLDAFVNAQSSSENILSGSVELLQHENAREALAEETRGALENQNIRRLAELWISGASIDWKSLYAPVELPKKISLPTYPFSNKSYWKDKKPSRQVLNAGRQIDEHDSGRDIERIIDQVDSDDMDPTEAARLLRSMV